MSQINGSEMSTEESHRITSGSENQIKISQQYIEN